MIKIPNQNWVSSGSSDSLGSLWSSWNLDLTSKPNKTLVSPRTIITTNDITDLGVPVAFQTFTDVNAGIQYSWAIAGQYLFNMNIASGYQTAFAKVTTSGAPTAGTNTETSSDMSDMINVGKLYLVVSTRTRMDFLTASTGAWVNVQYDTGGTPTAVTLTDATVHMLEVLNNRVYVTDANTKVRSVSASDMYSASGSSTLTSSGSYFLDLATSTDPITSISFIKRHSAGIWIGTINQSEDGAYIYDYDGDITYRRYIIPDASGILAGVVKHDTLWVIDNNARLMYFNGGSFIEAPNGKLPVKDTKFLKNSLSSLNDRWIHPNGIQIVGGKIRILIDNENEDNSATTEENIASGVWEYDEQIGWYHVLSLSLYTASVTDWGQNQVSRVGALYSYKTENTDASSNGTMLIGAQIFSNATSTKEVIAIDDSNDTLQKYGYLVTTKIYSSSVQDAWNKIYARVKKLPSSTDKIVVKYRTDEIGPILYTGTWASTTSFTVTGDLRAYVGYEVEVLRGVGGGKCSHITEVVFAAGTSTVTVDETYTGATGTFKMRLQKWTKAGSFTAQDVTLADFGVDQISTWIQFKVCLQLTGVGELDDLILLNTKHL